MRFGILILIIIVFSGCAASHYHKYKEIRKQINASFQDSLFTHVNWGIFIQSLENNEILFEHNADKMFIPASNQKIITSAAALQTLEPDFEFETKIFYTGEIIDSVLLGDLIIQGFGDPTFNLDFYEDPRQPFSFWADTLSSLGITKITGNIIGNDDAFDDNGFGEGWMLEDIDNSYAAEVGALQFNNNALKLNIVPPVETQESAQIITEFKSNYYSILNKTTCIENDNTKLKVDRPFGKNVITVSGNLIAGSRPKSRSVSIANPTKYYVTALKEVFTEKGLIVEGDPLDCDDIENWQFQEKNVVLLSTLRSPSLTEILTVLMKDSNNLYAETLVKTLGWNNGKIGSFEEGKEVVKKMLLDFDIQPDTYSYCDGSGLSRYNLISPRQITKVLRVMRNSENWLSWKDMFPIAGIDGTMKNRMVGTVAEGNIIAKTGTMRNVRCLSGYILTPQDKFVFSILVNGHLLKSDEIDRVVDNILIHVTENNTK